MSDQPRCASCPAYGETQNKNQGLCRVEPPKLGVNGIASWPQVRPNIDWCCRHPDLVSTLFSHHPLMPTTAEGEQATTESDAAPTNSEQYSEQYLDGMTHQRLRQAAINAGVEIKQGMSKGEIVRAILDRQGEPQ